MLDVPPPSPHPPQSESDHEATSGGGIHGPSPRRASKGRNSSSQERDSKERNWTNGLRSREKDEIGEGSVRSAEGAPGWSLVRRANSGASALGRKGSNGKRTRKRRSSTSATGAGLAATAAGSGTGAPPALEAISPLSPLSLSLSPEMQNSNSSSSVLRSRTMPASASRRGANESGSSGEIANAQQVGREGTHRERNVLKKQKRASVQPTRSPPGVPVFGSGMTEGSGTGPPPMSS